METREILMESDRVSVVFERIGGDKIRVTTRREDDFAQSGVRGCSDRQGPVGLVQVDKPIAYLDIDDTGLVEAGCNPETK